MELMAYPTGWTNDLEVSMKALDTYHPDAAIDPQGNVHIVWDDNTDDIYYAQVDESGSIIISQKLITSSTPADGVESNYPTITQDNVGDLWIFWQDNRSGNYEIYYARSTDNGRTWSRDIAFTAADGMESTHPRASAKSYGGSGRVYVTWQDRRSGTAFEVYFRQISYTNAGSITMTADQAGTPSDGFESTQPDVLSYKDWIYLVWADFRDGNNEIYFKKSNDMGATWTGEIPVSNVDGYLSQRPRVASNASGVHIIWEDFRENNFEVYYKKLEHNLFTSNTLIAEKRLSTKDIYDSRYPDIDADDGNIYVVWQDSGNSISEEISYVESRDDGVNFDGVTTTTSAAPSRAPVVLTGQQSESAKFPAIVTKNGNRHLIWSRKYSNNHDIFYKGTIVQLLETVPTMKSTGALLNTAIRMRFSKMMDANSLQDNIVVYGDQQRVAGTLRLVDYDAPTGTVSTVEFMPATSLNYNALYTVVIGKSAKDKNGYSIVGNAMPGFAGISEDDFIWNFSTIKSGPGNPVRNVVNSPNPFNHMGTWFNYVIDSAGGVIGSTKIKIYSVTGRHLRTLDNIASVAGVNKTFYDGRDKWGEILPNGVYLYKVITFIDDVECGNRGKMLVMRDGCCR
jgi:hypothetical protein